MARRGWSQSELARRSNGLISSQMVSMVLSDTANPGDKFCLGLAAAFHLPVAEVMRQAGRIEMTGPLLPQVEDWNRRIQRITPERRRRAILDALELVLRTLEDDAD
jgi:transcriptional regulator with XRE-family HTH domain